MNMHETPMNQGASPPGGGFGTPPAGGFGGPPAGRVGGPPGGGVGGPPGGGFGGPPQYEFSQRENETISRIAFWTKTLAIVMFISAGLSTISCNIFFIVYYVVVAIFLIMAGTALQKVVDTQGRDISKMIEALDRLSTSFLARIIVMLSTVALLVVGIVLGIVFFAAIAAAIAGGMQ